MMSKFIHFVKIFKTNLIEGPSLKIVSDPVKVEIFKGTRSYLIPYQLAHILPKGEEKILIAKLEEPLKLDKEGYHIEIMTQTKEIDSYLARNICEYEIDRIITILAIIYKPEIFYNLVYSGWIKKESIGFWEGWIKISERIQVNKNQLSKELTEIKKMQSLDRDDLERLKLMSRFYSKSIGYSIGEEKFILLWTILEIFPMQNQTKIRPILNYLANITGKNANVVDKKLGIGRLFKIRCDLVHNGKFDVPLEEKGALFTKLEEIVLEILRKMSGLNYSGSLDKYL